MANPSKRKGTAFENEQVKRLQDPDGCACPKARRVPYSGAVIGWPGDLEFTLATEDNFRGECKWRANAEGFKTIERWLADNDFLFLRRNRRDPMVVMEWAMFEKLLRAINVNTRNTSV